MTDKPSTKNTLPSLIPQNPSLVEKDSQNLKDEIRYQVDRIMEAFVKVLPSNYVSQTPGPYYYMQFQAAAEQIAKIQITAQESFADGFWDYTRPEFLFQILGSLVFPDTSQLGYPTIEGDLSYRDFLQKMVLLLLQGATKKTVTEGLSLLSTATFTVIEKAIEARKLGAGSAWTLDDQFTFEILVNQTDGSGNQIFPADPFTLQQNVAIVLRALKPAHTLYDYKHLFKEAFGSLFADSVSWDLSSYYYDDLRKYCRGLKEISGTGGITWTDRTLFSDATRSFAYIRTGARLTVLTGPNSLVASTTDPGYVGLYRIQEVRYFPVGDDPVFRPFTTSPTGLIGSAKIVGSTLEALLTDFALAVPDEILTFTSGPNAGSYRLDTVLGLNGGPVGQAVGPSNRVRISPSILRVWPRMKTAATGQEYKISIDRLGVQTVHAVVGEDASMYFLP